MEIIQAIGKKEVESVLAGSRNYSTWFTYPAIYRLAEFEGTGTENVAKGFDSIYI